MPSLLVRRRQTAALALLAVGVALALPGAAGAAVTIDSPAAGAFVDRSGSMTATTDEPVFTHIAFYRCSNQEVDCSGVGSWVELDGSPDPAGAAEYAAQWSGVPDGNRALRAVVRNGAVELDDHIVNVTVDESPPSTPVLTLSESSTHSHAAGTTLYYNPSAGNNGSFTVTAATADDHSGIANVNFPNVFGPGEFANDASSPYSNSYSWTDVNGSPIAPLRTVTATNGAGLDSTADFTVEADTVAPSGGSVSYLGGWFPEGTVTVTTDDGNDSGGSGIAPAATQLQRQKAPLTSAGCGEFEPWENAVSPDALDPDTCARYRLTVSDKVGNAKTYTSTKTVRHDATAPAPPAAFKAAARDHKVVLTWSREADVSFKEVKLTRARAGASGAGKLIYSGRQSRFVDRAVRNGVRYRYRIVALDKAGNRSTRESATARPQSRWLLSPADGAVVRRPPVLRWKDYPKATYYNVQLFRNGKKILSRWPRGERLELRKNWRFGGRSHRLTRGTYRWYVWPGKGPIAQARYGKLMGWSDFRKR